MLNKVPEITIGDYLSQSKGDGGLGLGTVITSMVFLITILATVMYLTITKRDLIVKKDLE